MTRRRPGRLFVSFLRRQGIAVALLYAISLVNSTRYSAIIQDEIPVNANDGITLWPTPIRLLLLQRQRTKLPYIEIECDYDYDRHPTTTNLIFGKVHFSQLGNFKIDSP